MNQILSILVVYSCRALLAITLLIVLVIILNLIRIAKTPSHIPWVGLKNRRLFPKLRACFEEIWTGRSMLDEGWRKYGKYNLPFIFPGMYWNSVVLPPSNAAWIVQRPESVISGNTTLDALMGLPYLAHGPTAESCRDFTVIRRDLTRNIMKLSDQIYHEIQAAFDDELNNVGGDNWKEINLHKIVLEVAFRAANKIFVGLPMCRDKKYKKAIDRWMTAFGFSVLIVNFAVPEGMKWIFLTILAIPTKLLQWQAGTFFIGRIKERLVRLTNRETEKHNDMMQWIIEQNDTKKDRKEMEPWNIAGKMILFNIFATSTTGMQTSTTLINLLSSPDASSILSQLHHEASQVMPEISKDPRQMRAMPMLDSLLRETLRYHPMTSQGLVRQVVHPGGVTTPDGVYLPRGTHIQCIVRNMHHDTDIFGDGADECDPLRYSKDTSPTPFAVQASPEFLSWGLGRHSCPGRFFAVHLMKLMLGHLFVKYELEPLKERPNFVTFGDSEFPSEKVIVKMRRRECREKEAISS